MEEREVLRGRIRDLWNRTQQGDYLNHTGFLALDLQSYAMQVIRGERIPAHYSAGAYCVFRGGYEEADRKVLLFVPSYMSEEEYSYRLNSILRARYGEGYLSLRAYIDEIAALPREQCGTFFAFTQGVFDYAEVRKQVERFDKYFADAKAKATEEQLIDAGMPKNIAENIITYFSFS